MENILKVFRAAQNEKSPILPETAAYDFVLSKKIFLFFRENEYSYYYIIGKFGDL